MYTLYAIYSESYNKIYIGYTADLEDRLIAHNHPKNKGWTRLFMPWVLVHSEKLETKAEAMMREKQLKSCKGRQFIWDKVLHYKLNKP
jgi:putative endonuclease